MRRTDSGWGNELKERDVIQGARGRSEQDKGGGLEEGQRGR